MRITRAIFYIAVAVSSLTLSVAQTTTDVNEFEIKGIKLGMTEEELIPLIGNRIRPQDFSIAGVKARTPPAIFDEFIDGKLSSFTFLFSANSFYTVVIALREKYREIRCVETEVQNRMGAKFTQEDCKLSSNSGVLTIQRYYTDLNTSVLKMRSHETLERARKEIEGKKKDV